MTDPSVMHLPPALADLNFLALNVRWAWHGQTRAVFKRIDSRHWKNTGHNPIRLLAEVGEARLNALAEDESFLSLLNNAAADLRAYVAGEGTWYARQHGAEAPGAPQAAGDGTFAYFSAEFGITETLRIYSGGLGVLAGDHLKSASDLGVPLVAVGLFYTEGYFGQLIDTDGNQADVYPVFDPRLLPMRPVLEDGAPLLVPVPMGDHVAHARIWRVDVGRVPLFLLDTNIPENTPEDRRITDRLYGGDNEHRLQQEIVLGIGGMRALHAMGRNPAVIHLNEGHAAFAAVERARSAAGDGESFRDAALRSAPGVVFTTHTPVAAGHDYFPHDLLERYLGGYVWEMHEPWDRFLGLGRTAHDPRFCMTAVAMRLSSIRNGVAKLHGVVSRKMWRDDIWPDLPEDAVPIGSVTNGVHLPTWVGTEVGALFSERIGSQWQDQPDEMHWHRAAHIPLEDLWNARRAQRGTMVDMVRLYLGWECRRRGDDLEWTNSALDPDALTIVFARRFATYKRATLLLSQPDRLLRLLRDRERPVQFIFAGKAHPRDVPGQALLKEIVQFSRRPDIRDRFIFLEGYDVKLARYLVQGADVWLNVPLRPYEASGTSGMKSAANGGLNLSIPDGWWVEAWEEHNRLPEPVGWSIEAPGSADTLDVHGPETGRRDRDRADADELFRLLEEEVVPTFYNRTGGFSPTWAGRSRAAIRQLGGYFNTHRMVREYVDVAYLPAARAAREALPESDQRAASGG